VFLLCFVGITSQPSQPTTALNAMKKTSKSSAGSVVSLAAPATPSKKTPKTRSTPHKTPSAVPDAGPDERHAGSRLPVLPADGEQELLQAAHELEVWTMNGKVDRKTTQQKIRNHRDGFYRHLEYNIGMLPQLSIAWPGYLYIPAKADYRSYWILPAPDDNRYKLSWSPAPMPAGYGEASHETGRLYCSQRIRTIDRYARAEAALGVIHSPKATLSVVDLRAEAHCAGDHRWYQMMDQPVAGQTSVKTELLLVVWQSIPGPNPWELLQWKNFAVAQGGPNTGSGYGAITSYSRSFSTNELSAPFLLQANRTYLLAVMARVRVYSTLTDTRGNPLPLVEDGSFRVYGSLACTVPRIEIVQRQVHIP
jgi:hypothetical protein